MASSASSRHLQLLLCGKAYVYLEAASPAAARWLAARLGARLAAELQQAAAASTGASSRGCGSELVLLQHFSLLKNLDIIRV